MSMAYTGPRGCSFCGEENGHAVGCPHLQLQPEAPSEREILREIFVRYQNKQIDLPLDLLGMIVNTIGVGTEPTSGDNCRKCGRPLGWLEPRLCDQCREEHKTRAEDTPA